MMDDVDRILIGVWLVSAGIVIYATCILVNDPYGLGIVAYALS